MRQTFITGLDSIQLLPIGVTNFLISKMAAANDNVMHEGSADFREIWVRAYGQTGAVAANFMSRHSCRRTFENFYWFVRCEREFAHEMINVKRDEMRIV